MCGIVGWVDWRRDLRGSTDILDRMVDTLAPRGPDARGTWVSPQALIGHTRLAVIDREGGLQPMTRQGRDGATVLTYNGEIYNFPDLARELSRLGHRFTTRCDTEILFAGYLEWGLDVVTRLDGMFAFGIWDENRRELLLVRDRLGIKPLYYASIGDAVIFASEPKALLIHPDIKAEVDNDGLREIFSVSLGRTPGHALFRGIRELEPGRLLQCSGEGIRETRYWRLTYREHTDDLPTTAERLRSLAGKAVEGCMRADVNICTLLSGGIDSSALTALALAVRQSVASRLDSYVIDFGESEHHALSPAHRGRDGPWAERVAKTLNTCHHTIVVRAAELLPSLLAPVVMRDQPTTGDVDASFALLCQAVKKRNTVALTGEGADEVFGGYPWFHKPELLASETMPFPRSNTHRLLREDLRQRLQPEDYLAQRYRKALADVPEMPVLSWDERRRREMAYLSITQFLHFLLERTDRISMAAGVEARVPFCNHHLIEYGWNIPWALKNFRQREKGLWRSAFTGLLPNDVIWREKSAYPVNEDPQLTQVVAQRLLNILNQKSEPVAQLLDHQRVRDLARGASAGFIETGFGSRGRAMSHLLAINEWLKRYSVTWVNA